MAKIFWVEDQSHWIDKFRGILEAANLDDVPNLVEIYRFSEAARQRIVLAKDEDRPDIALLDAKMNGFDQAGFSVSVALQKKWPGIPVVFLSEHSGTDIEKTALETHQVHDFISKHQRNIEEVLCWRLKAALRLAAIQQSGGAAREDHVLSSGALRMDLDTWEVYWHGIKLTNPDNPKRPLAPTPRKILRCLVERSPRPVTPFQMAEFLEIDPHTYAAATYRQHVKTLRRAFDNAAGNNEFSEHCKNGVGIVAIGEDGAYCWKPIPENKG